jgi:hypothetical protein
MDVARQEKCSNHARTIQAARRSYFLINELHNQLAEHGAPAAGNADTQAALGLELRARIYSLR